MITIITLLATMECDGWRVDYCEAIKELLSYEHCWVTSIAELRTEAWNILRTEVYCEDCGEKCQLQVPIKSGVANLT